MFPEDVVYITEFMRGFSQMIISTQRYNGGNYTRDSESSKAKKKRSKEKHKFRIQPSFRFSGDIVKGKFENITAICARRSTA